MVATADSTQIIIALIAACASMVGSITAAVVTIMTRGTMRTLEKNTNSMKDALVLVTRDEAYERGKKDQISDTNQDTVDKQDATDSRL